MYLCLSVYKKKEDLNMEFIDLKAQYAALKAEIDESIHQVLREARFIGGPQVAELEKMLADFTGRKYCISCANGTDALQIAFMSIGVGAGDAVFCPDMTFVSSTEPAKMLGATSVFCDIRPDTYVIDVESLKKQVEAVIAEGKFVPKCVVAVDILGNPADYDELETLCEEYGLTLIEDAAQSFGALYKGVRCAKFGKIAATSFFPAKPLGCYGDGGAVFTDDDAIAARCRQLCVHGKGARGKYDNVIVGMNSRLDTLQAAILIPKFNALKEYEIDNRQRVAERYNEAFMGVFQTPYVSPQNVSVYAQYALLAESRNMRDSITAYLSDNGIPNMIYYPTPQHQLPVFAEEPHYEESFKNAIDYCSRTFSLPMHPYLDSNTQNEIISAVFEALNNYKNTGHNG